MRRTRLAALFTALVLILSLAVPALAADDPAEQPVANIDNGGNVCQVGSKLFLIDVTAGRDLVVRDMEAPDGGEQSLSLPRTAQTLCFQDKVYCTVDISSDGHLTSSLVRIDPDTLETEVLYQTQQDATMVRFCGRIGEVPYFWANSEPIVIFHIDGDGQIAEDIRVSGDVFESMTSVLDNGVQLMFLMLCVCQDGILIPATDGSLCLFDFTLDLVKQYACPGSGSVTSIRQVGDYYYCVCASIAIRGAQHVVRIARDGSGYKDLTEVLLLAGADIAAPSACDYGPGCVYAAFCVDNGLVDLYRLDTETLQARLLSTFQIGLPQEGGEGGLSLFLFMLGDGECLIRAQCTGEGGIGVSSTAWQHFTFTP